MSFSIDPRTELLKMERMLMLRIANLAITRAKVSAPFSANPRRPLDCQLLSSSSSSFSSSSSTRVVSGSAANVSNVSEEDDDLVYSNPPASSSVKPVLPDILQPGVVIYDGVCHLCHRGSFPRLFLGSFFPLRCWSIFSYMGFSGVSCVSQKG